MSKYFYFIFFILTSCGDLFKNNKHIVGQYFLVNNEDGDNLICYKDVGGSFITRTKGSVKKIWVCDSLLIAKTKEIFEESYYIINTKKDFALAKENEYRIGPLTCQDIKTNAIYSKCIASSMVQDVP